jgi:hypothetical protein
MPITTIKREDDTVQNSLNAIQDFCTNVQQGFKRELKERQFLHLICNLEQFKNIYQAILVAGIYLGTSALIATIFQPLAYLGAFVALCMTGLYLVQAIFASNQQDEAKKLAIQAAYCFGGFLALNFMPVFLSVVSIAAVLYKSYDIFPLKKQIQNGLIDGCNKARTFFDIVKNEVQSNSDRSSLSR